jgi:hypothetical protein
MIPWKRRFPGPTGLQELRDAAEDIEQQGRRGPPKSGSKLEGLGRGLILVSSLIGVLLGGIHLWKTAFPKHAAPRRPEPQPPASDPVSEPQEESHEHRRRHEQRLVRAHGHQSQVR